MKPRGPRDRGRRDAVAPFDAYEHACRMIASGDVDRLGVWLGRHPGLVQQRDHPDGAGRCTTLLHEAALHSDTERQEALAAITALLLRDGAAIEAVDREAAGETPLHYACRHRNAAVCEVLLRSGADPEAPGAYENGIDRPLGYALFFGRARAATATPACVQLLLHYGARIDLPYAAALGRLGRIRQFFQDGHRLVPAAGLAPPQQTLAQGLLFAAQYGHVAVADYLLNHGADVNACLPFFDHHCTALHLACEYGQQTELVAFLLGRGADPTVPDRRFDATPLGWAMFCGQDEVFQVLRSRG